MLKIQRYAFAVLVLLFVSACATLSPRFEKPEVTVSSFRIVPNSGIPRFEIDLNIMNPNGVNIALRGMSYSASIEGHRVISGVANDIPELVAYGSSQVTLNGGIDLMGGLQLVSKLLSAKSSELPYELSIKLDAGALLPDIRIQKSGKILPVN